MSDGSLFGNTAQPTWMSPDQRTALWQNQGLALAEPFSKAFQQSFAQSMHSADQRAAVADERKYLEDQKQAAWMEVQPVVERWKQADSLESGLKLATEHPEDFLNPRTQPIMVKALDTLTGAARVQQQAENSRLYVDRQKRILAFEDAIGGADQQVQSDIDALPNHGWTVDANGARYSISPEALSLYNSWAEGAGRPRFNATRTESDMLLEQKRQENRLELERERGEIRRDIEEVKANRRTIGDSLYLQNPVVEQFGGETFVRWGKQMHKLDNPRLKAEVGLAADRIRKLQGEIIKGGAPATEVQVNELARAKKAFDRLFPAQAAPASPAAKPAADINSLRTEAQAAIQKGKDPAAVRARFRELTGQDL